MIATALKIQNATGNAVTDFSTMIMAKKLMQNFANMTQDEQAKAMFEYSAHLASLTATLVTSACLTESQMDAMISDIKEFDKLGEEFNG
jgi:hypothetical protein